MNDFEHYWTLYAIRDSEANTYKIRRDTDQPVTQDTSLLFDLMNSNLDFVLASEAYCVSNYEMAFDVYDCYTGRLFRITYTDCDRYMTGETVELVGHIPDTDEQDAMISFDPEMFPDRDYFKVTC